MIKEQREANFSAIILNRAHPFMKQNQENPPAGKQLWNKLMGYNLCTHPDHNLTHDKECETELLSLKEEELALSSLRWRDPRDPEAVVLLYRLICSGDHGICKRAISLARRFLHHRYTVEGLKLSAGCPNEPESTRIRALQHLDDLFHPAVPVQPEPNYNVDDLKTLKKFLFTLIQNPHHNETVRARTLEVGSWFIRGDQLEEWILYFYNREEPACRVSALKAMGRVDKQHWRSYLIQHLQGENKNLHFAAREALATPEHDRKREHYSDPLPSTSHLYWAGVF